MAVSMNRVIVAGHLGGDADFVYRDGSGNGFTTLTFDVAVTERWRTSDGKKGERTEWIRCVLKEERLEGGQARDKSEWLSSRLLKGVPVLVEGSLRTRSWEQDGARRYTTEVHVEDVQLLAARSKDG